MTSPRLEPGTDFVGLGVSGRRLGVHGRARAAAYVNVSVYEH